MSSKPSDFTIELSVDKIKPCDIHGDEVKLPLEIQNFTTKPILATNLLLECPTKLYRYSTVDVPIIRPGDIVEVEVTIKPSLDKNSHKPEHIPDHFKVTYCGKQSRINAPFYLFTGHLSVFTPAAYSYNAQYRGRIIPQKYNILVYGIAGAAKSSWINSVLTLLSRGKTPVTRTAVGGSGSHVTRKLICYSLEVDGLQVNIWDTMGLDMTNYRDDELNGILEGVFPDGWEVTSADVNRNLVPDAERKIHSVIFFVPHASLNSNEVVELIRRNCAKLEQFLTPLLVISKTDEINADLKTNPSNNACLSDLIAKASAAFNIPKGNIFTPINYTYQRSRTFEIDRYNYIIFEKILNMTFTNLGRLLRHGNLKYLQ